MRLVAAIDKASELDAWDDQHNKVVCGLNEANNSTHHMRTNQGSPVKQETRLTRGPIAR